MLEVFGLILLLACAVLFGVYILLVMWTARQQAIEAPRTEMFVCDKHGTFPKKYGLKLMEQMEVQYSDGRTELEDCVYCPMCWEDRMREAAGKR